MARILGIDIPNNKRIETSLTYIYGINFSSSKKILEGANISKDIRTKDLTAEQINQILHTIDDLEIIIEGDLRREQQSNMKRLMSINCYRAIRHRMHLPVRGQRTSTNARTRKGKKRTVGIQKRAGAKKGKV